MVMFKDGQTLEQVADQVLKNYLLRCYDTVSKQYQPIEDMSPEQGVEYLFKMINQGKIVITFCSVGDIIECTISVVN